MGEEHLPQSCWSIKLGEHLMLLECEERLERRGRQPRQRAQEAVSVPMQGCVNLNSPCWDCSLSFTSYFWLYHHHLTKGCEHLVISWTQQEKAMGWIELLLGMWEGKEPWGQEKLANHQPHQRTAREGLSHPPDKSKYNHKKEPKLESLSQIALLW